MWNNEFDKWLMQIVPECYFDTVLLKTLINIPNRKRLNHQKGCNEVANVLKKSDDFAIGLIDKDKRDLDLLKNESEVIYELERIILWKRKNKNQFIFQICPPLENWICLILRDDGKQLNQFEYNDNVVRFKKEIKSDIDNENNGRLNKLVKAVIETNAKEILFLKKAVFFLLEKNRGFNIVEFEKEFKN